MPSTLEVTFTRTWQLATAAFIEAPVTVIVPVPAVAVTANPGAAKAPPAGQLVCTVGAAAITALAGSVSVKLRPDCAGLPALLVMVNVSVVVPPEAIDAGANALVSAALPK